MVRELGEENAGNEKIKIDDIYIDWIWGGCLI